MLDTSVDVDAELAARADAIYATMERPTAREVAEKLIGEAPSLVDEWVSRHLAAIITEFVGRRWRARVSRNSIAIGAFADAVEEFNAGSNEAISVFTTPMPIGEEGRRVLVGDMTGADHRFVAIRHRGFAKANKMAAAFHEAVAKKLGDRTTSELFTEEQYLEMRSQYVKGGE